MEKLNKSRIVCLLILLFSFILNFNPVHASTESLEHIDFTISYKDQGKKIKGIEFMVYRIANLDNQGKISLTDEFKKYPIEINNKNVAYWNDYANTIKGYVKRDKINPLSKKNTDSNGEVSFILDKGVYLVIGEDFKAKEYLYKTNPYIVMLPEIEKESGKVLYKTISRPKFTKEKITNNKIDLDVLKVWNDSGRESERPSFITVDLLENGKLKDSIRLSKENNWTHTWKNLDPDSSYLVIEKNVDDKYKVRVESYGKSFTITNTIDIPPTYPPKKPPRIPQTGQLWWPVYLLSALGIVSISIGYAKEKRKGECNEK
ncbi:Cna B-type domain-containing protein [Peptococcus simiae]|uniref:Cna B-type domain-containing protein n=1 Tax=Peptococcus simiae TaxID=1643805 RepID=UPI003980B6C4